MDATVLFAFVHSRRVERIPQRGAILGENPVTRTEALVSANAAEYELAAACKAAIRKGRFGDLVK